MAQVPASPTQGGETGHPTLHTDSLPTTAIQQITKSEGDETS